MFRRKRNASFGKVCLAAILASVAWFGAPAAPANAEPEPTEFQVSFGSGTKPRISGDRIVWTRNNNVFLFDIPTKSAQQITTGGKSSTPAIDGNRIVWSDNRDISGYTDIYMYDISTSQEIQITNTDGKFEFNPAIYGDTIVYRIGTSVYMYDIGQGSTTKINDGDDAAYSDFIPSIYGDYIVWHETVDYYKTTVIVYQISTGTRTELRPETSQTPAIYGSYIVWQDHDNDPKNNGDIYLYNLDTKMGEFIATGTTKQYQPSIGSKYAVWLETLSGVNQIVAYDLNDGTTTQITSSSDGKYEPATEGELILWQQGVNTFANSDIGPTIMDVVNSTATAEDMQAVLRYSELGLTIGDFDYLPSNDKAAIAAAVLAARPANGFTDNAAVQTAFDTALAGRQPIIDVNKSNNIETMKTNLEKPVLGLDLTAYVALSAADQYAVTHTVIVKRPENVGFSTLTDIQTALDESIQRWTEASWGYLGEQTFTGWFSDLALYQGTPYVVYTDRNESQKATVKKFDGTSWETVGNPGMSDNRIVDSSGSLAFDSSGRPFLAYWDQTLGKLSVKKFDGTNWMLVGNAGFSDSNPFTISLALDGNDMPYVAYREPGKAIVKKFNGTNWVTVGTNQASDGDVSSTRLVIDSNNVPYLAYSDTSNGYKATVMKLLDDEWTPVGSKAFSDNVANTLDLVLDSTNVPYIAFNSSDNAIAVMKFNGTDWVQVGSSPGNKAGNNEGLSLKFGGNTLYLSYTNNDLNYKATVKKFDGTDWQTVGNEDVTDGETEYLALAAAGNEVFLGLLDRARYMNNVLVLNYSNPVLSYTIETIPDQTASALTAGYASGAQETKTITIKRTGTGDLKQLATAITGTNAGSFELSQPTLTTLNGGVPTTTFTVKAINGLAAGTYTATVTVSADNMDAVTFTITQTVKPAVLKGDINLDGNVTPADALYITRYLAGTLTLTAEQFEILDMDSNNILDSEDVKIIMSIYTGGQQG